MYIVQATLVEKTKNGSITHQIPTFFLEESVQGLVSESHAAKIAESILNPTNNPAYTVHATAFKWTDMNQTPA
jgi:hypothetical protein